MGVGDSQCPTVFTFSISGSEFIPNDAVVVNRNDSQYLIRTAAIPRLNASSARQTCQKWGGDLTDIRNEHENNFIKGKRFNGTFVKASSS